MTRQLLDGTTAPPPLPGAPPALPDAPVQARATVATPPPVQPEPEPEQQALAGALPAWDLLPATGFVRRKR